MIRTNVKSKAGMILFSLIFIAAGILVGGLMVKSTINNFETAEVWLETEGKVERVIKNKEVVDGETRIDYDLEVSYYYEDEPYTEITGEYRKSISTGDTIIIYVDPECPNDFMLEPSMSTAIIGCCFGGVFAIVGLFLLRATLTNKIAYGSMSNTRVTINMK